LSLPRFSEKALEGTAVKVNERYEMRIDHTCVRGTMLRLVDSAPKACAAGILNLTEMQILAAARVTVKALGVDARLSRTKVLLYQRKAETNALVLWKAYGLETQYLRGQGRRTGSKEGNFFLVTTRIRYSKCVG
jgi:hypothetical protein